MIFEVIRTSNCCYPERKPCEEAFKAPYTYSEIFKDVNNENEFNQKYGWKWPEIRNPWLNEGYNHHVLSDGGIERLKVADDKYFIELESLSDLIDFNKKYHSIVLEQTELFPIIEIYDDYRE